jgi:hypothetical protein
MVFRLYRHLGTHDIVSLKPLIDIERIFIYLPFIFSIRVFNDPLIDHLAILIANQRD